MRIFDDLFKNDFILWSVYLARNEGFSIETEHSKVICPMPFIREKGNGTCAMKHGIKHSINFAKNIHVLSSGKCLKIVPFVWNNHLRIDDFNTKGVTTSANGFSEEIDRNDIFRKRLQFKLSLQPRSECYHVHGVIVTPQIPGSSHFLNNQPCYDIYSDEFSILSKNIKLNCCLFVFVTNQICWFDEMANVGAFVHIAIPTWNRIQYKFDYRLSECNGFFFLSFLQKH